MGISTCNASNMHLWIMYLGWSLATCVDIYILVCTTEITEVSNETSFSIVIAEKATPVLWTVSFSVDRIPGSSSCMLWLLRLGSTVCIERNLFFMCIQTTKNLTTTQFCFNFFLFKMKDLPLASASKWCTQPFFLSFMCIQRNLTTTVFFHLILHVVCSSSCNN